jgi:hypothetical protein
VSCVVAASRHKMRTSFNFDSSVNSDEPPPHNFCIRRHGYSIQIARENAVDGENPRRRLRRPFISPVSYTSSSFHINSLARLPDTSLSNILARVSPHVTCRLRSDGVWSGVWRVAGTDKRTMGRLSNFSSKFAVRSELNHVQLI